MKMAVDGTEIKYLESVVGNISQPEMADNRTEMEHLKNSIDDVFVLSNGIVVCCEYRSGVKLSLSKCNE
jgi:hypothetical protein